MKSSILVYLSLWSLGVASVASQKVRGSNGIHRKSRRLQNRTTFESFFEIEYVANGYGDIDFSLVGQALAIAYNNLLEPRFSNEEDAEEYTLYDDPFMRRMEQVEVLSVEGMRRLDEKGDSRELQSSSLRNLNVNLRVTGSCRGCSSRSKFTNQGSRRLLAIAKAKNLSKRRLQDNKGGAKGGSGPAPPMPPPPEPSPTGPLSPFPPPVSTPPPTNPPTLAPATPLPTAAATTPPPFDDPSTLPTEEELRAAYALEIQRWEFDIMNVTSLDEVDGPSTATTNSTRSGTSTARASYCGRSVNQIYDCP